MKNKLGYYQKIIEDLHRQIKLCELYKEQINGTVKKINDEYRSGLIDKDAYYSQIREFLKGKNVGEWIGDYNARIVWCHKNIRDYDNRINELTEKDQNKEYSFSKMFLVIGIISLMLGLVFFAQPTITGFFSLDSEHKVVSIDGYGKEGSQWMGINGLRVYERCLKVKSKAEFSDVNIVAKITNAIDSNDLTFSIYDNNNINDEPKELIGSCRVDAYDSIWKSCTVNEIEKEAGEYWACASYPDGNSGETYFTIAYQNGDLRRTALWTGENWQKLDGASYTIRAEFIQNE